MKSIQTRAAEIVAEWDARDRARAERETRYEAYVDHMVNVVRERRETLPCIHGTAMWPDRGQVCGACEAEAEADAYEDRTDEEIEADRRRAALDRATREAASAAVPVGAWMDRPF